LIFALIIFVVTLKNIYWKSSFSTTPRLTQLQHLTFIIKLSKYNRRQSKFMKINQTIKVNNLKLYLMCDLAKIYKIKTTTIMLNFIRVSAYLFITKSLNYRENVNKYLLTVNFVTKNLSHNNY